MFNGEKEHLTTVTTAWTISIRDTIHHLFTLPGIIGPFVNLLPYWI